MKWQWGPVIALILVVILFFFIQNIQKNECVYFSGSFEDAKSIAPKDKCLIKETSAYIAYIPPQVQAGEHVPLIVALSPSADAQSMISVLKLAADDLSVIVVASKESRNGLLVEDLLPGYEDLVDESIETLPVDENRIIFAGFSGGGQASEVAAYFYPKRVRGVITNCGKMMPDLKNPNHPHGKLIVFLASDADFNYEAMKSDSRYLEGLGWKTYWIEFEGGHILAPPETYLNAVGWLLGQMQ